MDVGKAFPFPILVMRLSGQTMDDALPSPIQNNKTVVSVNACGAVDNLIVIKSPRDKGIQEITAVSKAEVLRRTELADDITGTPSYIFDYLITDISTGYASADIVDDSTVTDEMTILSGCTYWDAIQTASLRADCYVYFADKAYFVKEGASDGTLQFGPVVTHMVDGTSTLGISATSGDVAIDGGDILWNNITGIGTLTVDSSVIGDLSDATQIYVDCRSENVVGDYQDVEIKLSWSSQNLAITFPIDEEGMLIPLGFATYGIEPGVTTLEISTNAPDTTYGFRISHISKQTNGDISIGGLPKYAVQTRENLINKQRVNYEGGYAISTDASSISEYGESKGDAYVIHSTSEADAQVVADTIVSRHKEPHDIIFIPRVQEVRWVGDESTGYVEWDPVVSGYNVVKDIEDNISPISLSGMPLMSATHRYPMFSTDYRFGKGDMNDAESVIGSVQKDVQKRVTEKGADVDLSDRSYALWLIGNKTIQGYHTDPSDYTGIVIEKDARDPLDPTYILAGKNNGIDQFYLDTDGKAKAGAGSVVLDENGIAIDTSGNFDLNADGSFSFANEHTKMDATGRILSDNNAVTIDKHGIKIQPTPTTSTKVRVDSETDEFTFDTGEVNLDDTGKFKSNDTAVRIESNGFYLTDGAETPKNRVTLTSAGLKTFSDADQTNPQCTVSTDGAITAGQGNVVLNRDGISISTNKVSMDTDGQVYNYDGSIVMSDTALTVNDASSNPLVTLDQSGLTTKDTSGTTQCTVSTDGMISAGAGAVKLNKDGLFTYNTSAVQQIKIGTDGVLLANSGKFRIKDTGFQTTDVANDFSSGNVQVEIVDGVLKAGAGKVSLESNGLSFDVTSSSSYDGRTALRFVDDASSRTDKVRGHVTYWGGSSGTLHFTSYSNAQITAPQVIISGSSSSSPTLVRNTSGDVYINSAQGKKIVNRIEFDGTGTQDSSWRVEDWAMLPSSPWEDLTDYIEFKAGVFDASGAKSVRLKNYSSATALNALTSSAGDVVTYIRSGVHYIAWADGSGGWRYPADTDPI